MTRTILGGGLCVVLGACSSGGGRSSSTSGAASSVKLTVKSATFTMTVSAGGQEPNPNEGQADAKCSVVGEGKVTASLDAASPGGAGAISQAPAGSPDKHGNPISGSLNLFMAGTATSSRSSTDCPTTGPTAYTPCGPTGAAPSSQMLALALTAPTADSPIRVVLPSLLDVAVDKGFECLVFDTSHAINLDAPSSSTLTQLAGTTAPQVWEFTGRKDLTKTWTNPSGQVSGTQDWKLTLEVVPGR